MAVLAVVVVLVAVGLVPALGHRPPPRLGTGDIPRFDLRGSSGSSFVQNDTARHDHPAPISVTRS